MSAQQQQIPIVLLKEGTTETKDKDAQRNNITAAKLVAEIIKSSLGPRGMDKMLVDALGDVTISNDGATILKDIDVQHPAAKMMVEVSKSIDNEVGDGTTSSVVVAGSLLEKAQELIDRDVHRKCPAPSTSPEERTCPASCGRTSRMPTTTRRPRPTCPWWRTRNW